MQPLCTAFSLESMAWIRTPIGDTCFLLFNSKLSSLFDYKGLFTQSIYKLAEYVFPKTFSYGKPKQPPSLIASEKQLIPSGTQTADVKKGCKTKWLQGIQSNRRLIRYNEKIQEALWVVVDLADPSRKGKCLAIRACSGASMFKNKR